LIDEKEFYRATTALGIKLNREEAKALFDSFDPDGSGTIEYNELSKLLRARVDLRAEKKRRRAKMQGQPGMVRSSSETSTGMMTIRTLNAPLTLSPSMGFAMGSISSAYSDACLHRAQQLGGNTGGFGTSSKEPVEVAGRMPPIMAPAHVLPPAAMAQVERLVTCAEREHSLRRSASLSRIGLPTGSYLLPKEVARTDIDHLTQLWLQPRMGSKSWARVSHPTPVLLPPLTAAKHAPARLPRLSPDLSRDSVRAMYTAHRISRGGVASDGQDNPSSSTRDSTTWE